MSAPSGINFEQLQSEILAAESYLRTSVSSDTGNDNVPNANVPGRKAPNPLEETKRINILQQLGRRPLGAADNKDGENSPDSLNGDGGNASGRYNNPRDKEMLINRLINEHNAKKQGATAGSPLVGSPLLHTEDSGNSGRLLDSTNEGVSNSYNNSEVEDAMNRIGDDSLFYASDLFQYKSDNADMPELGISQSVTINRNKRPTDYSSFDSSNAAGGHGKHRYLKSKDDLELEAQISRKKEYTFKPQLSSKVVNSNNKSRSNISSRIEEMNQQREHAIRAREKQKKELEEFEIDQYCTFQPEISKGTKNILRHKAAITQDEENEKMKLYKKHISTDYSQVNTSSQSDNVASRLFNEAEHRLQQQKWLEKKVKEARLSQYSFKPSINPLSQELAQAHDQRPIHERVGDLQREKNKRLQELRQSVDNEQIDLTFHPSIDNNSKRMAEQQRSNATRQSNNVADRLMQEGRLAVRRKQKLMADRELIESSMMEAPKPSKGTEILAKKSNIVGASFEERQLIHSEKMKENEELRNKEVLAEQASMFKPEIHKKSVEIVQEKRPQTINETPEERVARLSKLDAYEMERKRKEKEQRYYSADSGYTFQPKIDPVSKVLGKKSGVHELTNNTKGKNIRENAKRLVDAIHAEECTFHPKINKSRPITSDSGDVSRGEANKYIQDHKPFGWVDCPINDVENYYKNEHSINRSRIDLKHPERMARDIKLYLNDKEEKRRSEMVAKELEELKDCTFQPNVQQYIPTKEEPVVVKGLSRHLELQNLSSKLKEDALKREGEVFRVKNVDNFRHPVNGNTIVRPFHFNSSKQGPSKAVVELESKNNSEYTYRPVINDNYVSSKSYSNQYVFNPYQ